MFSIEAYVKQNVKHPMYSEVLYERSVGGAISKDLSQLGAVMILIISLAIQTPAGAVVVTLTDINGRVVLAYLQQVEMTGIYPWYKLIKGSQLQLISNVAAVNFTVGYQYINTTDTKAQG